MSKNTSSTRSKHANVVSQVDKLECLLSRATQPSYHTVVQPSADDAATMVAGKAAFDEPKLQVQAFDFVNQLETIDPSSFMNVGQAAFSDLENAEVERQVADSLSDSIATVV